MESRAITIMKTYPIILVSENEIINLKGLMIIYFKEINSQTLLDYYFYYYYFFKKYIKGLMIIYFKQKTH